MDNTNHPNPVFNFSPSIFLDRKLPISTPIIAHIVKVISTFQSKFCSGLKSPRKPIKDCKATIKSDVPTAIFIGVLARNNKAGIIKKPPPAPTNPAIKPIIDP